MISQGVGLKTRIPNAILALFVNIAVWVLLPLFLSPLLTGLLTGTRSSAPLLDPRFVFAFGGTIAGLHALSSLFEGSPLSIPLLSGASIASAAYIWTAVEGGTLAFTASGIPVRFEFRTLLFLLVLPYLFSALRAPLEFLLDRNEVNFQAKDIP